MYYHTIAIILCNAATYLSVVASSNNKLTVRRVRKIIHIVKMTLLVSQQHAL